MWKREKKEFSKIFQRKISRHQLFMKIENDINLIINNSQRLDSIQMKWVRRSTKQKIKFMSINPDLPCTKRKWMQSLDLRRTEKIKSNKNLIQLSRICPNNRRIVLVCTPGLSQPTYPYISNLTNQIYYEKIADYKCILYSASNNKLKMAKKTGAAVNFIFILV